LKICNGPAVAPSILRHPVRQIEQGMFAVVVSGEPDGAPDHDARHDADAKIEAEEKPNRMEQIALLICVVLTRYSPNSAMLVSTGW
jgi:hypothetical protein